MRRSRSRPKTDQTPTASWFYVKRIDARKVLGGIPARTFATLESEGVIVPMNRGRRGRPSIYDLATIVPAYIAHVSKPQAGGDREARRDRDSTLADLNRFKLAKDRGDYVPRKQVVFEGQAHTAALVAMVEAIPRRMMQAGLVNGNYAALAAVCREILDEIARWRTLEDLQAVIGEAEKVRASA